jgi:hypothetical protein
MANIFTLENVTDFSEKINIDELYERKRQHDLTQLALYNKLLNRIHVRIKTTAKQKIDEQFCWFVVPEIMIGVPKYDNAACIAYLIDKLKENGFNVRYIHPNALMISWNHFVPSYVRNEIKKKTGIIYDEYGNKISDKKEDDNDNDTNKTIDNMFSKKKDTTKQTKPNNFTPINSYKPQGSLVYGDDLLTNLGRKIN